MSSSSSKVINSPKDLVRVMRDLSEKIGRVDYHEHREQTLESLTRFADRKLANIKCDPELVLHEAEIVLAEKERVEFITKTKTLAYDKNSDDTDLLSFLSEWLIDREVYSELERSHRIQALTNTTTPQSSI